jgi:hypothetical protein
MAIEGRGACVTAWGPAQESLMVVGQLGGTGRRWSRGTDRAAAGSGARAGVGGAPMRPWWPEVGGGADVGRGGGTGQRLRWAAAAKTVRDEVVGARGEI